MQKSILLLFAVTLCASLTACGGTGNPDHDYVLTLMEKGDYDMAITVLENLKAQSGTVTAADPTPAPDLPEETPESASALTSEQLLVADTVRQFMADKGDAMIKGFEAAIGQAAREPVVIGAIEYMLGNCDSNGSTSHCMLIAMEADIAVEGGVNDNLQFLPDMDTQEV